MTTTLDKDYRLELPKELRGRAGFEAGIPLQVTFLGEGLLVMPLPKGENLETPAKAPIPFTEEDVESFCKEARRELWKERYDRHA